MALSALVCVLLLAFCSGLRSERWSRQISPASDFSDWVPLPRPGPVERQPLPPIKRQAVAEPRILSEPVYPGFSRPSGFSEEFNRNYFGQASGTRPLYLQSVPAVPSAPQNYLSDQGFSQVNPGFVQPPPNQQFGQGIRFGLSQPNFPLSQGFVGPQFTFDSNPSKLKPSVISNPIRFENAPKQDLLLSPQAKPFVHLPPKKINPPMFVDGYRAENASDFGMKNKKPLPLQKLKFEVPRTDMVPPPNKAKSEREEVQLLYVPVESLNRGSFNFRSIPTPHHLNSDQYNQNPPKPGPVKPLFASEYQRPQTVIENFGNEQDFFTNFKNYNDQNVPDQLSKHSTISTPFPTLPPTTPKPKKLKPHQPPLAIFSTQEAKRGSQFKVGDVLALLMNAPSVAVLDAVNPATAPKVFIGPSNLNAPENYVKFELPYLSNIDHSDKKLRQLPFFVAPLSYHTPQGFAKIPFPSPHVGSVVINSQIKDTLPPVTQSTIATPAASVIPNSYSTSPYRKPDSKVEQKPGTQKPSFSYYSTVAPKTNPPPNHQSNYYSFEPQPVSTLKTTKEPLPPSKQPNLYSHEHQTGNNPRPTKEHLGSVTTPLRQSPPRLLSSLRKPASPPRQSGSYYLRDQDQYDPSHVNFSEYQLQEREPVRNLITTKPEITTTRHTVSTTTAKPSTYPSQLLETHNPYSINQAFHFSTPLDYHTLFEEAYATPKVSPPPPPSIATDSSSDSPSVKSSSVVTEENYQSPNYLQNYSPEIQYQSEKHSSQTPVYSNEYTNKPELSSEYSPSVSTINENTQSVSNSPEDKSSVQTQAPENTANSKKGQYQQTQEVITKEPYYQYDITNYEINKDDQESSSQTTTQTPSTTTTTKRTIRNRGRPRYTTTPRSDSNDSSARTVTRRPLRERKPATRAKYEPSKTTEKTTSSSKNAENESTTKYSRGRTRGRIQPSRATTEKESEDGDSPGRGSTQYKSSASDDYYGKSNSGRYKTKVEDLAYQRDVLHQNYPVTLQERTSTKDIDAITEPSPRISSTRNLEPVTEVYDTENAYSYDRASISHQIPSMNLKGETDDPRTDTSYVSTFALPREDDYNYKSSVPPVESESTNTETPGVNDEGFYTRKTTSEAPKLESHVTEPTSVETEKSSYSYSISNEFSTNSDLTTATVEQETKVSNQGTNRVEPEENSVQTTPSYNKVRVRPGVIRQYHQASSTESSKIKTERRRPSPSVTFRPAFNQRRTTMRIEEIENDFKTKQVHVRPEVQETNRHPVYRPEPTIEPVVTTQTSQDSTKRSVFRRRRPSYTTTTTEGPVDKTTKKAVFEIKSRFRGRKPSDRTTEKSETEITTTVRNTLHSRYSNRPKLSERFNKKPQEEEQVDQETNYSFNRPKYIEPEGEIWSPKISTDSFKPYNPNDIVDDTKAATTERKLDFGFEEDIITAKNEYDDILLTVTPATNNKEGKKIPNISPTLEALVEQTKTTKSDSEKLSNFETMLDEVMKSLEEQDENEYSSKVMKNKGGEIGEIPPERVISSGDNETTVAQLEQYITTVEPTGADDSNRENETSHKVRRRGFWKKVKVRPVTESIETAESQYYTNTVNRLGNAVPILSKRVHDKNGKDDNMAPNFKPKITTYKPSFQFMKDFIGIEDDDMALDEAMPIFDIPKIGKEVDSKQDNRTKKDEVSGEVKADVNPKVHSEVKSEIKPTEANIEKETPTATYPGDLDLGTGSPDSTIMDVMYHSTSTVPTLSTQPPNSDHEEKNEGFSFMDYLFGYSSNGNEDKEDNTEDGPKIQPIQNQNDDEEPIVRNIDETVIKTEEPKNKIQTTESSYIPEEFTATTNDDHVEKVESEFEIKKLISTDKPTTSVSDGVSDVMKNSDILNTVTPSSFMDPTNVMSTSMSTEVSHETEICFRGKCIKTSKDIL